ncbi:MAG: tetratricopeptide repeat protein [Deltaproteobacteria bacterium]|nr:tetratricopeptide repeat protein [Deltaproteobacteria bacterium]
MKIYQEPAKSFSYRNVLILLLPISVALLTFLVYLPSLKNNFVWDDDLYVYNNPYIRNIDTTLLYWSFTSEVAALWHPLTIISLAMDYAVWGLDPFGYHLTNNLIHALNTLLVFILVLKLLKIKTGEEADIQSVGAAFITAALFGIHPLHVESVAWISERKDVLCAFFYILCLIKYLDFTVSKRPLHYGIALGSFFMALLSKPMAVSLPIVILILDFYPLGRFKKIEKSMGSWRMLLEKLPFFLLSIFTSLVTIWAHLQSGALQVTKIASLSTRVLVAAWAYIFYMVKMVLPFNLAPLYPYPKVDPFSFTYLGSLFLMVIITFVIVYRKERVFIAVWLYYLVTLLPVIGIIKVGSQAAADRYTYLPSLGLFFIAGLCVSSLFKKCINKQSQIALIALILLILGVLANKTIQQITIWHDPITLWSHELRLFPNETSAYINRGGAYASQGNFQLAIMDYNKAIEIDPKNAQGYYNRGFVYKIAGNYQEALNNQSRAIELNPQYAEAYNNRGNIYNILGNYQEALKDFNKAIEISQRDAIAYNNRGTVYYNLKIYQKAILDYNGAIQLNPRYADAYFNRGHTYLKIGNSKEAFIDFKKAAKLGLKHARDYLE